VVATGPEGIIVSDEVGVVFTEVPQPTGHHPTLYVHSDGNPDFARRLFMNTLAEDAADSGAQVAAETLLCEGNRMTYQWRVPLSPGLGLGLHAAQRNGLADISFGLPVDLESVIFRGAIQVDDASSVVTLASWAHEAGGLMASNHRIVADIVPAETDPIPFQHGANLFAVIQIEAEDIGACTAASVEPFLGAAAASRGPVVLGGGLLSLPLQEYHEPVDLSFAGADGLRIQPSQTGTVLVNSGQRLALRAVVSAESHAEVIFDARSQGSASVSLSTTRATLAPGVVRDILLTIDVADDATSGDRIQLIVFGQTAGGTVPAIAQFHLEIDDSMTHDSPEKLATKERESPMEGPPIVLLAVALLAIMLRRRRGRPGT
jgi:hypothetical protein